MSLMFPVAYHIFLRYCYDLPSLSVRHKDELYSHVITSLITRSRCFLWRPPCREQMFIFYVDEEHEYILLLMNRYAVPFGWFFSECAITLMFTTVILHIWKQNTKEYCVRNYSYTCQQYCFYIVKTSNIMWDNSLYDKLKMKQGRWG